MRSVLGVDLIQREPWLRDTVDSFTKQNVALIKSITDDAVTDIEGFVQRGLSAGSRHTVIQKEIKEQFGVTRRRAKLIARDQVAKLNGQITKTRQEALGLEKYRWRTSRDERVRGNPAGKYPQSRYNHWAREGKTFSWEKPPPDGHPGFPIQCRCTAEPVFEEMEELLEMERPTPVVKRKKRVPVETLAVRKFEKTIRTRKVNEVLGAVDDKGKLALSKIGGKDYVTLTDSEVKIIKGKTVTHNHPSSQAFSPEDIRLSTIANVKEMRAVGDQYTYSMKPPRGGWNERFYREKVVPAHQTADTQVRNEFWIKIRNRELSPEDATMNHNHEVWKRVADLTKL